MTGWAIGLAALVLVVVAVATAVVVLRTRSEGLGTRGSPVPARRSPASVPRDLAPPAGGLVLLQLSASFSRSCRDTHAVLADVAGELPGVTHREIDLATRPELPSRLGVDATPTTLLVDATGTELLRVGGVPRRRELAAAVTAHLPRRTV